MGLSCFCDGDSFDYYAAPSKNFKISTKKYVCHSCKKIIEPGEFILDFETWEIDESGSEIYGDDLVFCEKCGEYYWNLEDLGFCVNLEENMQELVAAYKEEYLKISQNKK
jgi:DNA-directed RNA polymerase subunit RPC12/RpoP